MVAYLGKADLFPLLAAFPEAVRDVKDVAREATDLRLVSGVKNFERILSLRRLRRLWCFKLNEKSLAVLIHCTSLERLYVDGLRYENLDALTRLRGLIVLSVILRQG